MREKAVTFKSSDTTTFDKRDPVTRLQPSQSNFPPLPPPATQHQEHPTQQGGSGQPPQNAKDRRRQKFVDMVRWSNAQQQAPWSRPKGKGAKGNGKNKGKAKKGRGHGKAKASKK